MEKHKPLSIDFTDEIISIGFTKVNGSNIYYAKKESMLFKLIISHNDYLLIESLWEKNKSAIMIITKPLKHFADNFFYSSNYKIEENKDCTFFFE